MDCKGASLVGVFNRNPGVLIVEAIHISRISGLIVPM